MKKIIDGKVFDSEKAELICERYYSNRSDFRFEYTRLSVTKAGNFVLWGEGGAMSRWREKVEQNTWSGGEGAYRVDRGTALQFAEDCGAKPDDIAKHFDLESL